MRIGNQRYGFQGFDIVRAPTAAVAKTPTPTITIAKGAANKLAIALPDPKAKDNIAVPNDPAKLTKAQVTGLLYKRLAENLIANTSPSIEQLLRVNLSLFKNNVDLEG